MAALGLHCWCGLPLIVTSGGCSLAGVLGILTTVASLVAAHGLSCPMGCGMFSYQGWDPGRGMHLWDRWGLSRGRREWRGCGWGCARRSGAAGGPQPCHEQELLSASSWRGWAGVLAESMGSRTGWPSPGEPCRRRRGNLYLSDPGAIGGHGDFEQEGDLIECILKESLLSCL